MLTSLLRTFILFIIIVIALRIMGKRQIGQLQPAELVVTILLSEMAATPMQDNDIPMLNTVIAILVLVSLEIIMSLISLKSIKMRTLIQGNSVMLINNGKVDQKQMKRLRYTLDDLLEGLRQKDVFDINDLQYAIAETDGTLSVLLKPEKRAVTARDINIKTEDTGIKLVAVSDGRVLRENKSNLCVDKGMLDGVLAKLKTDVKDIYLLTVDMKGNADIIRKEKTDE